MKIWRKWNKLHSINEINIYLLNYFLIKDGNWIQVAHVIPGKFLFCCFWRKKIYLYNQGCPPGLEYLTTVDKLQIKQIPSLLEGIYEIKWNQILFLSNNLI